MEQRYECPQCCGYGFVPLEEDGRFVAHACYHCGNTGWVNYDPEQAEIDHINFLLDEIAREAREEEA
jgi:hypothetical protein